MSKAKKSNQKKNGTKSTQKWRPFRWIFRHWGKLLLIAIALVGGYSLYLDAKIKARFEGQRWEVPAQIFARPLAMKEGMDLAVEELTDELDLLSYRKRVSLEQSGEYLQRGQSITLYRRGFAFPHGEEPARKVQIRFDGDKISEIYDLDQKKRIVNFSLEPWLITRLVSGAKEDRMLVRIDEVPQSLIDTLLLVEDREFYDHHGVVPLSILRALVANIKAGRSVQGGSTLTQQLIKNLFLTREKSLVRKLNEAWMALLIEFRYSKSEILEAYLNEVFLGQNGNAAVHGFGLASRFYFDRPLNELGLADIATLVAMVKGPSYYNPRRNPERVQERRDLILRMLLDEKTITPVEYQKMANQPIQIVEKARLSGDKHPAYMDRVRRELAEVLPEQTTLEKGIRVFVAMDTLAQRRAERAVAQRLDKLGSQRHITDLQAAMIVTDIRSGELRAIVGDRDSDYEGFNRALDARRPVGSVIKPAVYLTALEMADTYHLATPLADEPISMRSTEGKIWSPKNADKKFRGQVTLMQGLANSLNVPTVNLGMQVGLDNVAYTIQRLGVDEPVEAYPALTLGAVNFSPMMVNQMYQTIANEGWYIPLHSLLAVTDSDNLLMWQRDLPAVQRVDPKAVYLLNYALLKVAKEGTARQLGRQFNGINLAGKTGTTDDYRDSWFSGFDRTSLATVWVGIDDNRPTGLTGASGALQVFSDYLSTQHPKSLVRRMPQDVSMVGFDAAGRMRALDCPVVYRLPAIVDPSLQLTRCQQSLTTPKKKKSFWERLFGD